MSRIYNVLEQVILNLASTAKTVNGVAPGAGRNIALTPADVKALAVAGGKMTGAIDMNSKKITNLAAPTAAGDASPKSYVDDLGLNAATHAKSGTVHTLTAPTGAKNLKFKASAAFADGDTIKVNGTAVTAKTQDGEALPAGAWASGAVVVCFLEGSTLFFRGGGSGGSGKSRIIATAPTGSTVTASMGSVTKTASEKNGTWTFPGCDLGTWTVKAVLGIKAAEEKVVIAEDGHLFTYYVSLYFQLYPSDFDLSAYGTKGVDYEVVQDNDTVIPAADYQKYDNWKVRLLTSGKKTITAKKRGNIDLFVVGAGAGNYYTGSNYVWRGTGGDVKTLLKFPVDAGDAYPVVIGAGGIGGAVGGNTSGFGVTANGGYAELTYKAPYFAGVYEFGAPSGTKLYGGNYPDDVKKDGEPNTGFGSCNGGKKSDKGNNGGSGIIIFRNARG